MSDNENLKNEFGGDDLHRTDPERRKSGEMEGKYKDEYREAVEKVVNAVTAGKGNQKEGGYQPPLNKEGDELPSGELKSRVDAVHRASESEWAKWTKDSKTGAVPGGPGDS